ncbi:MAG: DUF3352 domain-containing protein [Thermostichales cyanobacterium GMQP_bins_62]
MKAIGLRQGVIGLLTSIGLGTLLLLFWLLWQSPLALLWHQPGIPEIMKLIPDRVDQAVILTAPLPKVIAWLQTLTPPPLRRRQTHDWQHWLEGSSPFHALWQQTYLRPQQDIFPWLGSQVAYARLGEDFLLVLSTRHLDRSNQFLNLLWLSQDLAGSPLSLTTYKGVQVVSFPLEGLGEVATAALGDEYVLISSNPDCILTSIDTWERPQHRLLRDPEWERMPKGQAGQIGWWFERGQRYLSLGVSGQGITLRGSIATPALGSRHRPSLLKHLPPQPTAFLAGESLALTWQQEQQRLPAWLWDPWQRWLARQPLPWPQSLPPSGEFALALVQEPKQKRDQWLYVSPESSAPPIETLLKEAGWTAYPQETFTYWDPPQSAAGSLVTARQRGVFYLSSSSQVLARALRGIPSRRWTAHLPIDNLGYSYIHFPSGEQLVLTYLPGDQPMLQQVKGLLRMG